jgi:L-galactose dehydrogenase
MEYRKLGHTGLEVSVLSFGASSLGGVFHDVAFEDCVKTVRSALDGGINFTRGRPEHRDPILGS